MLIPHHRFHFPPSIVCLNLLLFTPILILQSSVFNFFSRFPFYFCLWCFVLSGSGIGRGLPCPTETKSPLTFSQRVSLTPFPRSTAGHRWALLASIGVDDGDTHVAGLQSPFRSFDGDPIVLSPLSDTMMTMMFLQECLFYSK